MSENKRLEVGHYYKVTVGTYPVFFKIVAHLYGNGYKAKLPFKEFDFSGGSIYEQRAIEISILEGLREVGE